jgi:hypothetical protein
MSGRMSIINTPSKDVKSLTPEEHVFGVGFERDLNGKPIERGHGAINHLRYVAEETKAAAKAARLRLEDQDEEEED